MKYLLALCFMFWSVTEATAQPQPSITIPFTSDNIQLVPLESPGFLIMDFSSPRLNQDQLALPVMNYDTDLKQRWKNVLPVTRGLQLQHYQVVEGFLFMIFSDSKDRFLEVYRVDLQEGHFQKSQYLFSNSFSIEHIAASATNLWASGTMANQGVLFYLDESKNRANILPTAFRERVKAVRELVYHKTSGKLSFLLLTEIGKQQTYVLRSLQAGQHQVIENLELIPPPGIQFTQARYLTYQDQQYLVGTSFRKDPEQANGIFLYVIKDGELVKEHFQLFKETPQFAEYTYWQGADATPEERSKKPGSHILMDEVLFHHGYIILSLDVLEKRYQAKGALQQEMERNQLIANLDQDQYGRRALDQAADENQTAEDRINRRSATDIQQYRYRNALISQPSFRGLGLERNILLAFDHQFQLQSCHGTKTGKPDLSYLGAPNTFITPEGIRQYYDQGDSFFTWIYKPEEGMASGFNYVDHSSSPSRIVRLSNNEVIIAHLDQQPAGFLLHLEKASMISATDQP